MFKKKYLTLICLLLPLCCFAEDDSMYDLPYPNSDAESLFLYGKVNAMGAYPMAGLGVRVKKGYSGFDLSGSAMVLNPLIYYAKASYLFFPIIEGPYLGVGGGVLTEPESIQGISAFGEGALGYQWQLSNQSHLFLEGNFIAPYKTPTTGVYRFWPGLSFGVGF